MKVYLSGVEILLTLRDATDVGLFARIRAVLPKLLQKVADASTDANGTQPSVQAPQYAVHQVPMRQQHKNGESWWSHFVEAEKRWCKGK